MEKNIMKADDIVIRMNKSLEFLQGANESLLKFAVRLAGMDGIPVMANVKISDALPGPFLGNLVIIESHHESLIKDYCF